MMNIWPHKRTMFGVFLFLILLFAIGLTPLARQAQQALFLAQQAVDSGLDLEASEHLASAAEQLPWRADLWELAGRHALLAGDYQSAIRFLEHAHQVHTSLIKMPFKPGNLASLEAPPNKIPYGLSPKLNAPRVTTLEPSTL